MSPHALLLLLRFWQQWSENGREESGRCLPPSQRVDEHHDVPVGKEGVEAKGGQWSPLAFEMAHQSSQRRDLSAIHFKAALSLPCERNLG
ncbi:hypothetical protein CEXT_646171 [Caerostris extrusa]|uniref:Secreted protein n=1 Tax=Caerostris extrusa TaxID=172846 RepID=A0AAV4XE72_CAEEX|nr:hypothetical protein CEXT_646171 [Caerostris extrusa]